MLQVEEIVWIRNVVINNTIWNASVLVLLMQGIYGVRRSGGSMYTPTLKVTDSAFEVVFRSLPQQFQRLQCSYYKQGEFI
jgi:hypothetical protein